MASPVSRLPNKVATGQRFSAIDIPVYLYLVFLFLRKMLTVLSLPPWVRYSWLMIWNWLNFIWLIRGRIEENNGHSEELHLGQPISQECGAQEETTTAEGNGEVKAVGEIEVQGEAMGELQRRNAELTQQLERRMKDKEYFSQSKRQTSLQIEKLVRQNLALKDQVNLLKVQQTSLQLENSDLKIKLQEANSKSLGNIPRDDTVAFGWVTFNFVQIKLGKLCHVYPGQNVDFWRKNGCYL